MMLPSQLDGFEHDTGTFLAECLKPGPKSALDQLTEELLGQAIGIRLEPVFNIDQFSEAWFLHERVLYIVTGHSIKTAN